MFITAQHAYCNLQIILPLEYILSKCLRQQGIRADITICESLSDAVPVPGTPLKVDDIAVLTAGHLGLNMG